MNEKLVETAALLSDSGRLSMIVALLGNVALPAGQLALSANVAPQTASSHLSKLVRGRMLTVERQGRHRYYRLANAEVAHAIEALLAIAPASSVVVSSRARQQQPLGEPLAFARTCYSHLAGKLAVAIAEALQQREFLVTDELRFYSVTEKGRAWFESLGVAFEESQLQRPGFARRCLDWTERRHHLAGNLGSSLLTRFRELKWLLPIRGSSRAMRLTMDGEQKMMELLGIRITNGGSVARLTKAPRGSLTVLGIPGGHRSRPGVFPILNFE